tara:strand:- start:2499 stop:2960 length:462 start_codon:yes stop_codon:yes gene_type:complete
VGNESRKVSVMLELYKKGFTLQQIGERYGFTREYIRQLMSGMHTPYKRLKTRMTSTMNIRVMELVHAGWKLQDIQDETGAGVGFMAKVRNRGFRKGWWTWQVSGLKSLGWTDRRVADWLGISMMTIGMIKKELRARDFSVYDGRGLNNRWRKK